MAVGTGRVSPADFFIKNAHITSSNPAKTRKTQATVEALLFRSRAVPDIVFGEREDDLSLTRIGASAVAIKRLRLK
jgi:hypothetical protein